MSDHATPERDSTTDICAWLGIPREQIISARLTSGGVAIVPLGYAEHVKVDIGFGEPVNKEGS